MPSRHLLQQPSPPHPRHHRLRPHHHSWPLFLIAAGVAAAATAVLFILAFLLHRRRRRLRRLKNHSDPPQPPPTDPDPDPPSTCRPFTYSDLRRATSSFSPSNKLGQGGFGPVYLGNLTGKPVAVKVLDPGSLQGEREFRNELWLAPVVGVCDRVVAPLGFCSGPSGRMLVYDLMRNGSVQEALLDKRRPELMVWGVRLSVALDVARALEFLHFGCNPPIVHGDVKPSNVLLDADFSAKIADFGLARFVVVDDDAVMNAEDDNRSLTAESECTTTVATTVTAFEQSPEPVDGDSNASPAVKKRSASGGDWWRRQDRNGGGGGGSSNVKDYVMQWIGSEVNRERPRGQWAEGDVGPKPEGKKMKKRPMEWWASLDEERRSARRKKKKPREWWREEFCEELTNKANKKKQKNKKADVGEAEPKKQQWWQNQSDGDDAEEVNSGRKKLKKGRQRSSDWWADGANSELRIGRRNSQDSGVGVSGDTVPKSGGVSSTPSMRGTVCYAAPEYGGGGPLSEKCDVYSFGVLMLVIISGRRPLQVACSPMSEFERANLVSWARQLARVGKLMDLVDQNICNLDSDQALMCITVALLCLQRSPARRPSMKEVVGFLCGETEPPHLPVEFSPSPPGGFTFKSPKKARQNIEGFKIRQVTT